MLHPEWLGDFSKEDYQNFIDNDVKILIYKLNNKMIASGILLPATQKSLEKLLATELDYQKVIDYGLQMVHPDFVGKGLQHQILNDLNAISKENGYEYALSTIHPETITQLIILLKTALLR